MIEIIGIVLMMLGVAVLYFGGFNVIGDFEPIKEAIMYCLLITIAVSLVAVGCYLMA